jgi:hypothetical protein
MANPNADCEFTGNKGEGIYLFGFARPHALCAIEGPNSEEGAPLAEWVCQDVAAVFRRIALAEWTGESSEKNLQDLTWVGPLACLHEKVIEGMMIRSPVLPARFATLFSSLENLAQLIVSHYGIISAFLDSVVGKEEWAVKMLLDKARAEEHLLASLLFSENREACSSPGRTYLYEQRLRDDGRKKLHSWVTTIAGLIAGELESHAVASRSLKPLPRNASGRDKDMAFNWAFLLARDSRGPFHARANQLSAQYADQGMMLDISGPWPPYSFCPSLGSDLQLTRKADAQS